MNKKILFVSALSLILVGCEAHMMGDPPDCPKQTKKACTGNPQTPTINLNTQSAKLKARPECANAEPGTVLVFRLTPPGNKDDGVVKISPKNAGDTWLAGTNDEFQDLILIPVPDDIDGDFYYKIETDTNCVDPRINVN